MLVIMAPSALEPIRYRGKINWRVDDHCVEIDAATWHQHRLRSFNHDWSAESSGLPLTDARPQAIQIARDFLYASQETRSEELAGRPEEEILRRLNALTGTGELTNAGALMFVGPPGWAAIDYIYRQYAGADSAYRSRLQNRSLLESLDDAFKAFASRNSRRHLPRGLTVSQVSDLPDLAVREAIVNGVAHRDWASSESPTVIEHVGKTLRVTSPGGFVGGVNPGNIITHPSQSRNPSLAQLLADLRIVEREGVGVDRMVREMIRVGHPSPDIREVEGPFVVTSLVGDTLDVAWIEWLNLMTPAQASQDVYSLLLTRHVINEGWLDEETASPVVQLTPLETSGAINRLESVMLASSPFLIPVHGVPANAKPAWSISPTALTELKSLDRNLARGARSHPRRKLPDRSQERGAESAAQNSVLSWVAARAMWAPHSRPSRRRGFWSPHRAPGGERDFIIDGWSTMARRTPGRSANHDCTTPDQRSQRYV